MTLNELAMKARKIGNFKFQQGSHTSPPGAKENEVSFVLGSFVVFLLPVFWCQSFGDV